MATPWQQVLQQVPALNNQQAPFSFTVGQDGAIIGFWDVAKIQMLGLMGASTFDKEYRIEVRPTDDGEYDWTEFHSEAQGEIGSGGASFSRSGFKGKSTQKSFGFQAGLAGASHGQPTNVAGYSFDTDAIKDPLKGFLTHFGWEKKKGFFGRLFS